MSRENVKVVREAWEAASRHDNEAVFPFYDVDVEIQGPFGLDDRVFRGLTGVQEFWRDWLGSWGEFESDVEEWIDAGDDVIAVMHVWGHGKRSGVPVEARQSHVWTLRGGKLWRLRSMPPGTKPAKPWVWRSRRDVAGERGRLPGAVRRDQAR